jgi:hypothetical protein
MADDDQTIQTDDDQPQAAPDPQQPADTDQTAGKIGTPADPNVPSDSPIKSEPIQSEEDANTAAAQEQINAHKKHYEQMEGIRAHVDQLNRDIQRTPMEVDSTPPEATPLAQRPMQERSAYTFLQYAFPAALALGMVIAGSRGKRSGVAASFFLGSAMKAYSEGRNEESKRRMDEWWKKVQYDKTINQERLANNRAVMENNKLSLDKKMDILKTYHELYQDEAGLKADDTRNLKIIQKRMQDDEKAQAKVNEQMFKAKLAAGTLTRDKDHKDWADVLRKMAKDDLGYIPPDSQLEKYMNQLPFEKFRAQRKAEGKTDSSGKTEPIPGEGEEKTDYQKHLDSVFGTAQP